LSKSKNYVSKRIKLIELPKEDDDDEGAGIKNVMHYRDSGLFGFTQMDIIGKNMNVKSIDSDSKVLYEYHVTKDGNTTTDTTEKTIAK
jgi:hypothetical protein